MGKKDKKKKENHMQREQKLEAAKQKERMTDAEAVTKLQGTVATMQQEIVDKALIVDALSGRVKALEVEFSKIAAAVKPV